MNFQDLCKRTIYTAISVFMLVVLLIFAYQQFVQWIILILTAIIGAFAIGEFLQLKKVKRAGYLRLLVVATIVTIFSFFVSTFHYKLALLPVIFLYFFGVILFLYHFNRIEGCTYSIAQGFFGLCYIAVPLGLIIKILYFQIPYETEHLGRFWLIYLLVVTKSTDIGAYFGGQLFGNKKLATCISPSKTIVGAVSGFITALIFSILFQLITRYFPSYQFGFFTSLCLGAIIGLFAQLGDLAESLLKRDARVKDSNRLPGLGGILDMVDSLLFTAPIIFFFLCFF